VNRKAEQLKFLDGKEIIHVQDKACIQANYPIGSGDGSIQIYDLFPGIQLMINDFQTDSCFQSGMEQNAITIDHCRNGRFECVFDRQHYLYLGEGDFSIHNVLRSPIRSSFPLHYFYGSTIILFPESCENAPELQLFGINTERLTEKYQLETQCHVFRRNEDIDHVYSELYEDLKQPDLPFLRLKVLEIIYHLQSSQIVLGEKQDYLSVETTERVKHIRDHLIQDMEQRISLKDLAEEHGLSLTQLKISFKQIYGQTPYAWLKSYKMHEASKMLAESDLKISEVASAFGYQNPSKFSEAFCAVMGKPPVQYRKEHRSE